MIGHPQGLGSRYAGRDDVNVSADKGELKGQEAGKMAKMPPAMRKRMMMMKAKSKAMKKLKAAGAPFLKKK